MSSNDSPRQGPNDLSNRSKLDAIVTEYVERLNAGEELSPFEILAAYPDHGPEILKDLEAYASLELDNAPLGTLGDYTLRRQIGRGGMGVVYEAWENSLDRQVALKVLPPAVAADARSSTRFIREAQIAAKLAHPTIVPVYASGVRDQTPYYAMEFVEGETLAQILAGLKNADDDTETPFGPKNRQDFFIRLAAAFADVADGLQHAHSRGVVHRDIKPSNLILDGEGKLRILDFGLARLEGQESLTVSGDLMGTVLYMSPEQAMAKRIPLDHRTDVYSLGATMYEVLTAEPPFRGKDQHDTLSQIIARDPRPPRQLNPRVPKDLETIGLKCLRKGASDRYGTAEALAQDLRRFVRGDPVEARRAPPWSAVARRLRRNGLRAAVGAMIVAIVAASLWIAWDSSSRWRRDLNTAAATARLMRTRGLLKEAETYYRKAREGESHSLPLLYGHVQVLLMLGRYDETFELLCQSAFSSSPDAREEVTRLLGAILIWGPKPSDLSALDLLLANPAASHQTDLPSSSLAALALAFLESPHRADGDRALDYAERAVERSNPDELFPLAALVRIYQATGNAEEASQTLRALCARMGPVVEDDRSLGSPAVRLDDFEGGLGAFWETGSSRSGQTASESQLPPEFRIDNGVLRLRTPHAVPVGSVEWLSVTARHSIDPVYSQGFYRVRTWVDAFGCHPMIVLRSREYDYNEGYAFMLMHPDGEIGIQRQRPGDFGFVGMAKLSFLEPGKGLGVEWILEAGAVGNRLSFKAWPAGHPEPEEPQLKITDDSFPYGRMYLDATTSHHPEPARVDARFDDVVFRPVIGDPDTAEKR